MPTKEQANAVIQHNKTQHQKEIAKLKEKFQKQEEYSFNQGRQEADRKWKEAIDERIEELEKLVGIPELRLLKKKTMYRWQ